MYHSVGYALPDICYELHFSIAGVCAAFVDDLDLLGYAGRCPYYKCVTAPYNCLAGTEVTLKLMKQVLRTHIAVRACEFVVRLTHSFYTKGASHPAKVTLERQPFDSGDGPVTKKARTFRSRFSRMFLCAVC
jgi:hypothetical protein